MIYFARQNKNDVSGCNSATC